jgi:hypothetical protein
VIDRLYIRWRRHITIHIIPNAVVVGDYHGCYCDLWLMCSYGVVLWVDIKDVFSVKINENGHLYRFIFIYADKHTRFLHTQYRMCRTRRKHMRKYLVVCHLKVAMMLIFLRRTSYIRVYNVPAIVPATNP